MSLKSCVQLTVCRRFSNKALLSITTSQTFTFCKECQKHFSNTSRISKWFALKKVKDIPVTAFRSSSSSIKQPGGTELENKQQKADSSLNTDTRIVKDPKIVKLKKKKSFDSTYLDNIYIEPGRALVDYLLVPRELEKIPKYPRRSPYGTVKSFIVYKRKDVEEIAIKKYGSLNYLNNERSRLEKMERFEYKQDRSQPWGFERRPGFTDPFHTPIKSDINSGKQTEEQRKFFQTGSGQVVIFALAINAANTFIKGVAWAYTGSSSIFAEMIHSGADTVNQIILGVGLYKSHKKADSIHPYGYSNLRYVSSLISGMGIFFIGAGLSLHHGLQGLMYPQHEMESQLLVLGMLAGSLVSEGATLWMAIKEVRSKSQKMNISFRDYVLRGYSPNVTVVLLEDMAAVSGVTIAGISYGLFWYTGNPLFDAAGSILISGLLAGVALFIVKTNSAALLIRSIPQHLKENISYELEQDRMIRSLHDVKATEMGGQVKFKAEVDFDGREITRAYLYKLDMEQLLKEMHSLQDSGEAEEFMLKHGQRLIDSLGEEIDRIEKLIKDKFPEIRHVDLEAL